MGFRSTFVTEDYNIKWPKWFVDKYDDFVNFGDNSVGSISSKKELKLYCTLDGLEKDIQKAINWKSHLGRFVIIFLHECGGITRCEIAEKSIRYSEPESYYETEQPTHSYCYGCSDLNKKL